MTDLAGQMEENGEQQVMQEEQAAPDMHVACAVRDAYGVQGARGAQNMPDGPGGSDGPDGQHPPKVQPAQRGEDSAHLLEELAVAEAQLKVAQERYAAAKAKVDALRFPSGYASSPSSDTPPVPDRASSSADGSPFSSGYIPPSHLHSRAQSCRAGSATPSPGRPAEPNQQAAYTYQYSSAYVPPCSMPPHAHSPYAQNNGGSFAMAPKDHVAAGLLAVFLGWLGIHKFYLGYNTAGFTMLAIAILGSLFSFGLAAVVVWVIAIVEGVLYLGKSQTDFEQVYVFGRREWF